MAAMLLITFSTAGHISARFGILRLVRDLMSVSGNIEINERKGAIKRITLNRAAPPASGFFNALRALLLPEQVSIILDKI
jgi:hypothetical protein